MIPKSELRWYLFEDSIKNLENFGYPNFRQDFIDHMKTYLAYYPLIKTGSILSSIIPFFPDKKDKNTFLAHHLLSRYPNILRSISQENNLTLLAKTPLSIPSAFQNRANYFSLNEIYKDLYQGILNNRQNQLDLCLKNLKNVLLRLNPQFILVSHDVHPEDRLMVLAAKELEVPTIEIQHGMYSSLDPIVSGKEVDFVFLWGNFFKNLYINQNIKKENQIRILGYPHNITRINNVNQIKPQNLVYLGQNLEVLQAEFLKVKLDTIQQIRSISLKLGLNFFYRPHPSDDVNKLKKKLHNVKFISKRENLKTTFRKNELFVSFNSTALIEAALNSRQCIQLKNYDLKTDDFQKLGICKSTDNIQELEEIIKTIQLNYLDVIKPVREDYVMLPSAEPGKRFLELIESIK